MKFSHAGEWPAATAGPVRHKGFFSFVIGCLNGLKCYFLTSFEIGGLCDHIVQARLAGLSTATF